ncbi:MAG: hypothetical protein ACK5KN_02605 [Dysgonomonas sp.]|uniref:hypothetical protein n=1 Tax=Dysgonomonas sp. TaxID=1891233 RepID=UPI003A8C144A
MKKVIHQGFDFAQLGGFPLNQQRLEWMQTAYAELSGGLAAMFGDNVIVSGCIVSGQSVSDGWIVVNGELLPFLFSQTGVLDTFLIRTDLTPLTFKDASNKSVQFRKYAQFGTSSDAIAWNTLKRLPSYAFIASHLPKTGRFQINPALTNQNVKISDELLNAFEYKVTCNIFILGNYYNGTGYRDVTKDILKDVWFVSTPVELIKGTNLWIAYDNSVMAPNAEYYCYYSISKIN